MQTNGTVRKGLKGVIAAETALSEVNGTAGELTIAGFPLEEIAPNASFEEIIHLLWHGTLPSASQLGGIREELTLHRELSSVTWDVVRVAAENRTPPMDALRMAAGTLELPYGETDQDNRYRNALSVVARFPVIVAAGHRLRNGLEPVPPRTDLNHVANYLHMITGEEPGPEESRALETYLNTVVDHGLNASTFAARVIIATGSDLISAVVGAVGALKGPAHGGAPGPALDMVFDIGKTDQAEPYLRQKLERGERLMGFGHRVYKVRDPRADVLADAAQRLFRDDADSELYRLATTVEEKALELLEEYKPGRNLQTNVEFYTALVLHGLGLPTELFTPTFAVSRMVGWIAHCFEQEREQTIIRPTSIYNGPRGRQWTAA